MNWLCVLCYLRHNKTIGIAVWWHILWFCICYFCFSSMCKTNTVQNWRYNHKTQKISLYNHHNGVDNQKIHTHSTETRRDFKKKTPPLWNKRNSAFSNGEQKENECGKSIFATKIMMVKRSVKKNYILKYAIASHLIWKLNMHVVKMPIFICILE